MSNSASLIQQSISCPMCDLRFSLSHRSHYFRHVQSHGLQVDWQACGQVGEAEEKMDHKGTSSEAKPIALVKARRHKCEWCGKMWHHRCDLLRHARIHTGERPFECGVCGKCFNRKHDLQVHTRLHIGIKSVTYEHGKNAFRQKNWLKIKSFLRKWHTKNSTNVRLPGSSKKPTTQSSAVAQDQCVARQKAVNSKSKRAAKVKSRRHKCDQCGKMWPSKSKLLRHSVVHISETKVAASKIRQPNSSKKSATKQRKSACRNNASLFRCSECNKAFASKKNFTAHMRLHTGERVHVCNVCSKPFPWQSSLLKHSRIHLSQDASNSVENSGRGLPAKHFPALASAHPATDGVSSAPTYHQVPNAAAVASASAALATGLDAKCNAQHNETLSNEPPFHCDQCDKRFTRKKNLRSHRLIHTNVRAYKCDQCDMAFKYRGTLGKHRKIHTSERPFQCSFCGKFFNRLANLRLHEMVHTGVRPFGCQLCEHRFKTAADQKRHHLIAHNPTAPAPAHTV